jgi:2-polyprenyl-6-methoxyphenol hydroxylase-like FAD-dependent oxidoreductase
MQSIETEVLVVGAGPVGLSLAGDLGWRGRTCLIIEQGDGVIHQAKMDGVGIRTMEFCRRWGIASDVEGSAYNRDYPQDNVYLTSLNGYELGRQRLPSMREDNPPPESPQKRERCPQNMFDPILRKFVESQSSVIARYRVRLISFEQDAEGVTSIVEEGSSGEQSRVRSKFLVGCDGGRSTVREGLGIQMQGKGVLTHTTNFIFRCPEFNQLHNKVPGYRYMFIGAAGTWGTIVAINGRDQWRMSIIGNGTERPQYSDEQLKSFAYKALGREFDLDILSVLRWTRQELVSDCYYSGRVFICGDACHLTSPTGGLGMNTGIGDAVDLSWKLAAQLEGWGGEKLSEAYDVERRPVARRITRFSTSNLETMQQVPHTDRIFADGPEGDEARRKVGEAIGEGLKQEWFSKNMHLGNRYTESPICVYTESESAEDIQAEFDDPVNYRPSTRPGCRAPHVWLDEGRSTLDMYGQGFVLVCDPALADQVHTFVSAAKTRGISLHVEAPTGETVRSAYAYCYVLVRPDGHIAWRGDAVPGDVDALLAKVTGH